MIPEKRSVLPLLFQDGAIVRVDSPVTSQDAQRIVSHHVAMHYNNPSLVLMYGSVAKGKQHNLSDIDIMVFSEAVQSALREQVVVDQRMLQISVMSTSIAILKLNASRGAENAFFPMTLMDSVFLGGDPSLHGLLKRMAAATLEYIKRSGGTQTNRQTVSKIANSILSLDRCQDERTYYFLVEQLAGRFREFVLKKHGCFGGQTSIEVAMCASMLGDRSERYDICYLKAIKDRDHADLVEFIWSCVVDAGFSSWQTNGTVPL